MAEQGTVYDLKGLDQHFHSLFTRHTCNELQGDSKPFCSNFCKVVEHYASCWKTPLPQLRILERALCCFTQASAFFTVGCEHVLHTLSSLALSIFELLLFFDQKDFTQDPLRKITVTFQECCSSLARFQNVHLLQVEQLLRAGGTWVSQTLQAILSESNLPQTEVEACISSEPPVFFELRVRYLLSCQRLLEAQALAKCCAQHPTVGQHMFFFQVYLTGLCKTAQYERLRDEVADFSGKDAVNFICSLETEENDDLLLGFSRVFLSQQLRRGDMQFLCDLVCLWGRLHSRLKTSKEALLKECEQLILCATNVNAIFPFIRAIIQELSEDGVQFCIEVCAHALRSCPPCDVMTKSLIYKTMASLVPNDLEICRACALLVFFLERSVEAYKMVYILYMHPDQEYHVECCPIGNRVRFETLQTLKKDLYFDPEFWNLIALRTNCLKLINEKVLSAALEEIMEEKWVPSYYLKTKSSSSGSKFTKKNGMNKEKALKGDRQNHKDIADKAPAKKVGRPRLNKHLPLKKGNQGSRQWRDVSSDPTRRSTLWQLDRIHCNSTFDSRENRRTTRLSEKIPAKRMIRTPKWLLEDSGSLEKNAPLKGKKQYPNFPYLPLRRRRVVVRSNTKDNVKCEEKLKVNQTDVKKQEKKVPQDSQTACSVPQVILELSLPDNELLGTFTDEPCNRHRGLPQRLFYKQTLKVPSAAMPEEANLQNEVILKAEDLTSFILMLHCYGKRPKGKKNETNSQDSSSTLTCSSAQDDVSNKEQLDDKSAVEMKVTISSQTLHVTDEISLSSNKNLHEKGAVTRDTDTVIESKVTQAASLSEASVESAADLEVSVATQNERHSLRLEKAENTEYILKPVPHKALSEEDASQAVSFLSSIPINEEPKPQETVLASGDAHVSGTPSQEELTPTEYSQAANNKPMAEEPIVEAESVHVQTPLDNSNNLSTVDTKGETSSAAVETKDESSSLADETRGETEKPQSQGEQKDSATLNSDPVMVDIGKADSKSSVSSLASNTALEDDGFDPMEPQPECEESKLEYCCFFCHKDFKGRHLIAHSMFHYRKDECMFCGVVFKNNLKAMMHLSNHLEKLKKLQNPIADNSPTQSRAKAKQKTTVKIKTASNELKRREREKKPNPTVRKLRSGYKFRDRKKLEEGSVKHMRSKGFVHKVNGHIGKKKEKKNTDRLENNLITSTRLRNRSNENHRNCEIKPVKIEQEKPVALSSEPKHEMKVAPKTSNKQIGINRKTGHEEKSCCPVDGCTWFTVNKPAAFLYHVLENHYPNTEPLELAFHMASNSCSICKRVLYSFEHFQHHVVRHRLVPRHPCPHKGCTARFKTTIEMRRHARKHSPLQAVCCLPGCPKLFICQWALILHEKDHFSKRSKAAQIDDKPKTQAIARPETQEDKIVKKCIKSKETVSPITSGKSPKDTDKAHSVLKKDPHAQFTVKRLLQSSRKRQENTNRSKEVPKKKLSSVVKSNYKFRHSLQREENKAIPSQGSKVLPPRQAKSSQNSSCVNNLTSGKEPKQEKSSEMHKKLKVQKKSTEGSKTISTAKVGNRLQRVASAGTSRKVARNVCSSSKNNSTISDRSKSVRRNLRRVAPVDDSPVLEESARLNTLDTTNVLEIVRNKKRFKKNKLKESEPAQTSNNAEEVVGQDQSCKQSNKSKVGFENVQEEATNNYTYVPSSHSSDSNVNSEMAEMTAISPVTKNLSKETPEAGKDKTEEFTDPGENSYMVSLSKSPCQASIFTAIEQNVASPQNVDRENVTFDHVFESTVTTVVQNPDCKAYANVKHSVEIADEPTLSEAINDGAFENSLPVEKVYLAAEDISIFDKMESTDLTDNANTSLLEEIHSQKVENIISEEPVLMGNMANSVNATSQPAVAQKPFRPKFCNKSDILSALKTLVKSKNDKDKSPTEVKNTAIKRKNYVIRTSASKKLKFEMQTQEDVATSVDKCSVSDETKATETTDSSITTSCAPVSTLSNENKTLKEKVNKGRTRSKLTNKKEKPRTVQAKAEKKRRTASKSAVDKSTKKTKREKSEPKGAKPKSKYRKMETKASTKPKTPHSRSMPSDDSFPMSNEQDHKINVNEEMHVDKVETKPEMQRNSSLQNINEPHNDARLKKQRDVFALVPENEESPLTAFEKALTEYKKRPYMRLPATAYLEEKFTVMPKRRKDMSMFFGASRKIQTSPEQRQRCANCFSTFSSEEQLQWHLQQKCSNVFGFDSDEEGTG